MELRSKDRSKFIRLGLLFSFSFLLFEGEGMSKVLLRCMRIQEFYFHIWKFMNAVDSI